MWEIRRRHLQLSSPPIMRTLTTSFAIYNVLGLWSLSEFRSSRTRLLYKLYGSIVILAGSIHVGTGIISFILTGRSLRDFSSHGCRLLSTSITFGKILNVLIYRKRILHILEILETDPCRPRDDEEILIQNKHNRNMRKITIQFGIIINMTISLMISHTILHDIPLRMLPRKAWFPYDFSDGMMYWCSCIFQVVTLIYLYIALVGYDTLVCGLFLEIATKLNILQYRLTNLNKTFRYKLMECNTNSGDIPKVEKDLITDCVTYHLCLLNLAKLINSTFSLIIFLQYVLSTAILCLTVYNISGMKLNSGMIFIAFYLSNMLLQIFLYCFSANEVTIESTNIANSVFHSDWIEFSRITWKSLMIIGCQSYRPIVFQSGYFVTLSLESFKSLIKVAYSTYSALESLH